ncbi:MAG TPA: ABC transporter permease [Candidatus Acidoferrum sp.]|nr:ABC transporter permease [Candidatus Acidoferrum sp.]
MTTFQQDVRYAVRMMVKTPGLSAIIILTLALGIGATTVVFSIANTLMLRPLPVPHASRIVAVGFQQPGNPLGLGSLSYVELRDFQSQSGDVFAALFGTIGRMSGFGLDGHPAEQVLSFYVTGNFFTGLGVKPALGRLFAPGEGEQIGAPRAAVLSYAFWNSHLGSDPGVVGRQALVNGKPTEIIGIAPKGFHGALPSLIDVQLYLPLSIVAEDQAATPGAYQNGNLFTNRTDRELSVLGMLNPSTTVSQAESEARLIQARLASQYSKDEKGLVIETLSAPSGVPESGILRLIAVLFVGLSGMVLLLACMNVANVLMARATTRRQEMAIRSALGAPRLWLIRQMLTEPVLLALLGAAAGVLAARWTMAVIFALPAWAKQRADFVILNFSFDWRVFLIAFGGAVLGGIAAGIWPAVRAGRADLNLVLHEGRRTDTGGGDRYRLRNVLVVAQVAGSLALLIAAGFFVQTLRRAQHTYLGFDPTHLVICTMDPHEIAYDRTRTTQFYRELKSRVGALPGVQSVSVSFGFPFLGIEYGTAIYVENRVIPPGQQPPFIMHNVVGPEYFSNVRIPLLQGRAFTESDDDHAPLVAVINQTMGRQLWPGENPIGKRFRTEKETSPLIEVVGLVADGKYQNIMEDPQPWFYVPLLQEFQSLRAIVVRSAMPPESLIAEVEREIRNLAPGMPLFNSATGEQVLEQSQFILRLGVYLAGGMGLLGLFIAVVGVYGVVSYAASQRTREVGIRVALGAMPADVLKLILRHGLRLVGTGLAAGVLLGWLLTRGIGHVFHGETGVIAFAVGVVLLAATGFLACYVPARRAMALDPMTALRHE